MSVRAMVWAFERKIEAPGAKLVLLALANYAGSEWGCFPGQETLARDTSMSARTVRRHLARLERDGFIVRSERRRSDGSRTSDMCILQAEDMSGRDHSHRTNEVTSPVILSGHEPVREPSVDVVVSAGARDAHQIHDEICEMIGVSRETHMAFATSMECIKWLAAGCEHSDIIAGVQRCMASRTDPPGTMRYFSQAVMDAKATRLKPLPVGKAQAGRRASHTESLMSGFQSFIDEEEGKL